MMYPPELWLHAIRPPIALENAVLIVPVYPPVTKLPPTNALVTSVKAPPAMFGDDTSNTPPSKKKVPPATGSSAKLFRNVICAAPVIPMLGVSSRLSLTVDGSSMNAEFGAESGVVLDVTQRGAAPAAFAATHPAGNAGTVTPSKFSFVPHPGVGVGVEGPGVGLTVGEGVGRPGVAVGNGVGVATPQQRNPFTATRIVSILHPVAETLESDAIRKRNLTVWPARFAPRFATVLT